MRRMWVVLLLLAAVAARAADVSPPSAIPTFGIGADVRQSRAIGAKPGEFVADLGYTIRLARSEFDNRGKKRPLRFNSEFMAESVPFVLTYGLDRLHTVGLTTTLVNSLEQEISLTNFQDGTTFGGRLLPLFSTTVFRLSGTGFGDVQVNFQRAVSKEGARTSKLVGVDVLVPTGRADSHGQFDIPPGKGNADVTFSAIVAREYFPLRAFAKLGQEYNISGHVRDARGVRRAVRSGNGVNLSAGATYQYSPVLQFKNSFVFFTRNPREMDGALVPDSARASLEARPGLDIRLGDISVSMEGLFPLTGRNLVRTHGFFNYVEFRF
jgi:hypothetical protein